jgi:hypothetical protein
MVPSSSGHRPEKDSAGEGQQELKLQIRPFVREGALLQQTRSCLKKIKKEGQKIGHGFQMGA